MVLDILPDHDDHLHDHDDHLQVQLQNDLALGHDYVQLGGWVQGGGNFGWTRVLKPEVQW